MNHRHPKHLHFTDSRRFVQSFWIRHAGRDGRWIAAAKPILPEAPTLVVPAPAAPLPVERMR